MKRDIQGMDADLEEYHRKNKLLQQDITSLQSKQRGLVDEIGLQRRRLGSSRAFLVKFGNDLHETYKLADDAKFKEAFIALYKKYMDADPTGNPSHISASSFYVCLLRLITLATALCLAIREFRIFIIF